MGTNDRPILALDTALDECSAVIVEPATGSVIASRSLTIGRGHAERLPSTIDAALERAGLSLSDIGAVGAVVGPGSFTGVRVGVAAARGYALALGIPAFGLVSLAVMAEEFRADRSVLAVHDAKRGEVYALLMSQTGEVLRSAEALAPETLSEFLGDMSGPIDLVGSGAALARDLLGEDRCTVRQAVSRIDPTALARLCVRQDLRREAKPLYLRSADAKPPRPVFSLFAENP